MKKTYTLLMLLCSHFLFAQTINLDIKVFLEGPYFTNEITPFLNAFGYIPETQPYSIPPWNYEGTESVTAIPNGDVIDWVLLELRQTSGPDETADQDSIIAQKAVFLLRNGQLADMDGSSLPEINVIVSGDLYAVIWHRNHLGVMSAFPMTLNAGTYSYDFTDDESKAFGAGLGHKQVEPGVWAMIGGDGNADGQIGNPDKIDVWQVEAGLTGYLSGDFDLNGQVDNADKIDLWVTNTGFSTQVPQATYTIWKCGEPFVDTRDGQTYETVEIGEQCWMVENINIGTMVSGSGNQNNNGLIEKYCFNNIEDSCTKYGGLYQWDEMMQYTTDTITQGICPSGWHLPTDSEWKVLEGTVDSQFPVGDPEWDNIGLRGYDAGLNLKSTNNWLYGGNGTNLYGFQLLPTGYKYAPGLFIDFGYSSSYWTTLETSASYSLARSWWCYEDRIERSSGMLKELGFPVRCMKETEYPVWSCGDDILDIRDGQIYGTVQIDDQCWMAENLNIGTRIDGVNNQTNNQIIEKYCFDNNTGNCDEYGGLYQWNEMMEYETIPGVKGICPEGWHLPMDAEWCALEQYVDTTITCNSIGMRGIDGGGKLKEEGTTHWQSPNTGATNSSGFTALPGGNRDIYGNFNGLTSNGIWWSSSESGSNAWYRSLANDYTQVGRNNNNDKDFGYSIRCLYDSSIINQPPNIPTNPSPSNGAININIDTTLTWSCSDPENDPLIYDVYFGIINPPPLVNTGQTDTIFDPGILAYDTTYYWKIIANDNHGNSTEGPIWSFQTKGWSCGEVLIVTHIAGDIAPVTKTVSYETVETNLTGSNQCWITQNLGADHQAFSATDPTEESAGWYWQFNRKQGYMHDDINVSPVWTITSIDENNDWQITNDPCSLLLGAGWRSPTYSEWYNADLNGGWNNFNDTYSSELKLHTAGHLHKDDGSLLGRGSYGHYWTSSQNSNSHAWFLNLYYGLCAIGNSDKAHGLSVRCLKDEITDNQPHATPSNPSPSDGSTSVGIDTTLSWSCSDPENDPLTFDVYFGFDNPPQLVNSGQSDTIYDPGVLAYDSTYYWKVVAHDNHGNLSEGPVWSFETRSWTCGQPLLISHTAGDVAPVDKTVIYGTVELNLFGGTCWITQNLGADHHASSATDPAETSAGWYWQFNKKQGYKHDGGTRTPNTSWITSIAESTNWQLINDPCNLLLGPEWHIPNFDQWQFIDSWYGWNNYNDAFSSDLKLHAAGRLWSVDGSIEHRGSRGYYWSTIQNTNTTGWYLYIDSNDSHLNTYSKANGHSIRCFRS
ncbi:MAG: hypothetical protein K8R53_06515, partial [Bacteroidales bacterium]|nr:hypothetical protein [Bacteroidales bacterium]